MTTATAECPRCHGTGWASPPDHPQAPVERCDCFREQHRARRMERARIPLRYQQCALANFDELNPALEGAKLKCERYVEAFNGLQHGLLFQGPVGVGKTHLAVAVLRALMERHEIRGHFVDYRDLLRDIQESYNPVSETSEMQILRPLLEADVLLLDELGARRPSAWVRDTVTHVLNDRYNRKQVTLITTNYGDDAGKDSVNLEERVGARLRSRLYEMCDRVRLDGTDYRRTTKSAAWR